MPKFAVTKAKRQKMIAAEQARRQVFATKAMIVAEIDFFRFKDSVASMSDETYHDFVEMMANHSAFVGTSDIADDVVEFLEVLREDS